MFSSQGSRRYWGNSVNLGLISANHLLIPQVDRPKSGTYGATTVGIYRRVLTVPTSGETSPMELSLCSEREMCAQATLHVTPEPGGSVGWNIDCQSATHCAPSRNLLLQRKVDGCERRNDAKNEAPRSGQAQKIIRPTHHGVFVKKRKQRRPKCEGPLKFNKYIMKALWCPRGKVHT